MGTYYDVGKTKEIGRSVRRPTGGKQPRIPNGHRLLAIMDNMMFKVCPDVTSPDEYAEFYGPYSQGLWVTMDLFLVPEHRLEECAQ